MTEQLLDTVKKLRAYGVPPGDEELIVGFAMFEKLLHAPDVVSGDLELRQTEDPHRWRAISHTMGYRFNIFVSQDMKHWVNQEPDD